MPPRPRPDWVELTEEEARQFDEEATQELPDGIKEEEEEEEWDRQYPLDLIPIRHHHHHLIDSEQKPK